MEKSIKVMPAAPDPIFKPVRNCGGKKKGGCANWAGATKLQTKIKVAA